MNCYEYGEAYEAGFDRTVRFLISKGARGDGAQEAAQAAWVRGWERLEQLRNHSRLSTWINSIAPNFYRSFLSRETMTQILPQTPGRDPNDVSASHGAPRLPRGP